MSSPPPRARGDVPERSDATEATARPPPHPRRRGDCADGGGWDRRHRRGRHPNSTVTTDVARSSLAVTTHAVAPTPGPLQRVEFRRGTNNATVDAELVPGTTDRYVLEAGSDQRMVVNVDSDVADIRFTIVAPDRTELAANEVVAAVELPADGDYVVEVSTAGAGGPYTIDFLIN